MTSAAAAMKQATIYASCYQDPQTFSFPIPKELCLNVNDKTTAAALRALISEKTQIPLDHISSLEVYQGGTKTSYGPRVTSYGEGPRIHLQEDDLVLPKMKQLPDQYTGSTIISYGQTSLSFRVVKCANTDHCPNFVEIIQMSGRDWFTFKETTTALDLKEALAVKVGIPVENQRFIFQSKQLSDETVLSEVGLKHEGRIHLVLRLPTSSEVSAAGQAAAQPA